MALNEPHSTEHSIQHGLRSSIVLHHHHELNRPLLSVPRCTLTKEIAHRGNHLQELKLAARGTNKLIRGHYSEFIHDVGRNLYPLIIFTDHEVDGPSGVGSTLTLYREDGSVTKVSPALQSNYELYKVCGHLLMGLSVEVGPYLMNASLCSNDLLVNKQPAAGESVPWRTNLSSYIHMVRVYKHALMRAIEMEGGVNVEDDVVTENPTISNKSNCSPSSSLKLPSPGMCEIMLEMMTSVIDFCEHCLSTGIIDSKRWEHVNTENFPRIKACMQSAVKEQADACVRQLVQWREMMGPEEWRELYVIIPTVWAVGGENPRKTMMRQLMDEDRVDSHIITSEYPRNHDEARTLLGRVVGDRSIGRLVFGDDTEDQRVKVMGLSSPVDVVQDDALPAIWNAMGKNQCPVRHNRTSMHHPMQGSGGDDQPSQ